MNRCIENIFYFLLACLLVISLTVLSTWLVYVFVCVCSACAISHHPPTHTYTSARTHLSIAMRFYACVIAYKNHHQIWLKLIPFCKFQALITALCFYVCMCVNWKKIYLCVLAWIAYIHCTHQYTLRDIPCPTISENEKKEEDDGVAILH